MFHSELSNEFQGSVEDFMKELREDTIAAAERAEALLEIYRCQKQHFEIARTRFESALSCPDKQNAEEFEIQFDYFDLEDLHGRYSTEMDLLRERLSRMKDITDDSEKAFVRAKMEENEKREQLGKAERLYKKNRNTCKKFDWRSIK